MVGVAARTGQYELSSAKNPMIKYMLKVRESHAKDQKSDYSHVFRKKTRIEMIRVSLIAMAIEFAYAAETAFVSPILLQIGINHQHMTMAWGLSPLLGFFIAPLLGSVSDRCKLNWGRRRPIITLLSIGIFLGLILVPHGKTLGMLLGDVGNEHNVTAQSSIIFNNNASSDEGSVAARQGLPEENEGSANKEQGSPEEGVDSSNNFKYAAIITILGMVLLDFDADTCQTPSRTYLLDMCIPEDQPKAMTTFTLMAGIGGTIGYAIGGIDWETTQIGTFLGGNVQTVFGLVTIIFVICYILTVTTFREIPLKLIEQDHKLMPLSAEDIKEELKKKNNAVYYVKETTELELQLADEELQDLTQPEIYQNGGSQLQEENEKNKSNKPIEFEENGDEADGPVSLGQYLKSIFVMPYSMRILALTNLLCWMGHVTYCLYFTDFVGEAVFHGNPMAAPNSEAAILYNEGVRFGCWGMSIYAFSCSVYSMTVSKLMKIFGTKAVYITGIAYYGVGMLILGLWPSKWGVLVFSTSAGILYGTLFTMPYILVTNYHAKNCFSIKQGETVALKQKRGLGTDVAIISSMVFVAQMIVAFSVGPLVEWTGTTCAILYASTFLSVLASISAMFVLYV